MPDLNLTLPKIYPITDVGLSGLSHIEQVRRLIEGGASFIQLRDKTAASGDFYRSAAEVMSFARTRAVKIIINDRVDIALAVDADGVHLGQDDLPPEPARELLGPDRIIGFSTHSIDQARAASDLPVDYIAIGPIFSTSTKSDHEPVIGLHGLTSVRGVVTHIPLVAIGGLDRTNLASVIASGADSAALIGAVVSDPEQITERYRELVLAVNNVGNG